MGTTLRPELSKKNKYWIEKERYFELKHFCLQYPTWKKAYEALDGISQQPIDLAIMSKTNVVSDPVGKCVEARSFYFERMGMVERAAKVADQDLWSYILVGVSEGISYDRLKARLGVPCCKDKYYDLRRRFFWLLDQERQ